MVGSGALVALMVVVPETVMVRVALLDDVNVGMLAGVTLTADDALPCPVALVARTTHEYKTPFVSPVTRMGDELLVAVNVDPEVHAAWYEVIAEPPLLDGAVKFTTADVLPPWPVPMVGAPGTVPLMVLLTTSEVAL
jgi:hypothetical protein